MATQAGKLKVTTARKAAPQLARAEIVDKATRARFEAEIDAALKRRRAGEAKLARRAARRRDAVAGVARVDGRGGERDAAVASRSTASSTRRACAPWPRPRTARRRRSSSSALAADECGGTPALAAACFSRDPQLAGPLAKIAASRQSHLAFAAETARVARRESNGAHLTALAPMIKESHRIALCTELFVPLARSAPVPAFVGPALGVLRGAERHLGRWLVLAEVAA